MWWSTKAVPDSGFETPEKAPAEPGADSGETLPLIARAFSLSRHTTHYRDVMNNSERSLDQSAGTDNLAGAPDHVLKECEIATNGISLHVTEQGEGPAVLFCREQMADIALVRASETARYPEPQGRTLSTAPVHVR
jgi:hypothetical protein